MVSFKALDVIRNVLSDSKYPVHFFIVFPKVSHSFDIRALEDRARYKNALLNVSRIAEDTFSFYAKLRKREIKGFIITYGNFWLFLTHEEKRVDTRAVLLRLVEKLYPIVSYYYIAPLSFLEMFNKLAKSFKLTVKEYLLRKKLLKHEWKGKKFIEVSKSWTERMFSKELFLEIMSKEEGIIDALRFTFSKLDFFGDMRVYRNGLITLYKGYPDIYPDIYRYIIEEFVKTALESAGKLSRVKRVFDKKKLDNIVHPLTLIYDKYTFTKDDYSLLLSSLTRRFLVSVYHLGNPLLHVMLTDKDDGSSFEIIAYKNKATIIPDFKASVSSLQQILDILGGINPHYTLKIA